MANNGYIIHFDEEQRKDLILDSKIEELSFSDALSVNDWKMKDIQVVLLSFTGKTIDYISLSTKGNRVATAKFRVEFSDLVDLKALSIEAIEKRLDENMQLTFMKSSSGTGGEIPPKTWKKIIEVIKELRPAQKKDIDRLLSLKLYSGYKFEGIVSELLSQEREAFGMALDIFGGDNNLRKNVLKSWAPEDESIVEKDTEKLTAKLEIKDKEKKSFMSGIQQKYILEEAAIKHDLLNWDGEKAIEYVGDVATFSQGERNLNIIYTNRNDLEKTLGVDLIYYNEEFESFILVQYKLMKEKNVKKEYLYRPDDQLNEEIKRMNEFHTKYYKTEDITSHSQFRLNNDGFLFKLVPNHGLKLASQELIKGMYLTREYMNFLLGENGPKGSGGGKVITFSNSPRYISNTNFSNMVNKGFIGTNNTTTNIVQELIKNFLETGRAVLIAIEDKNKKEEKEENANA